MGIYEQLAQYKATELDIHSDIQTALEYLCGPKFTGTDLDGSAKDWIRVTEVIGMLQQIIGRLNIVRGITSKASSFGACH